MVLSEFASLSKLALAKIPSDGNLYKTILEASSIFPKILPFTSISDLESFFIGEDFESSNSIETFYGTLKYYQASQKLQKMHLDRNSSLQQLCILQSIRLSSTVLSLRILLELPVIIFKEIIVSNFVIYWLPLTHKRYHDDINSRLNFNIVFRFFSNLQLFERMFDNFKDTHLFIHSWLQHSHLYSVSNDEPAPPNVVEGQFHPIIPPHELSSRLLVNVQESLRSKNVKTISTLEAAVRIGLKVGNFLNESSEYFHAFEASHAVYKAARTISITNPYHETTSIRWEYEAMCIMLRAMNSHNMYLEHEHRLIFYEEAPNLLLRISKLGLGVASLTAAPLTNVQQEEVEEDSEMLERKSYRENNETLSEASLLSSLLESNHNHQSSQQSQPRASDSVRSMESILLTCGSYWPNPAVEMASDGGDTVSISSSASTSSIFGDLIGTGGNCAVGELDDSTMHGITLPNCSSISDSLGTCSLPVPLSSVPISILAVNPALPIQSPCSVEAFNNVQTSSFYSGPISTTFLHSQLAIFYYSMCNYRLTYQFTVMAIDQIAALTVDDNDGVNGLWHVRLSPRVIVEVLRITCRVCIIQRKYVLGMRIIQLAISFVQTHMGCSNVTYSNLLLEYGCLLLNTDKTYKAAEIYRLGLAIILDCLPGTSIMAALALEDIAYAYYVLEYTSGDFGYALECADVAGQILRRLKYEGCMQAASANRVKALILEEIAIDDNDPNRSKAYLYLARDLHMESLSLCKRTFGLLNIQTAKHFGNLGRLFQSMEHNKTAEEMHLKAISIKERLLGPNDFEVGLSVGHLASLYNYHMHRFEKAEALYLRSIQISLTIFGPAYSGLEYDYRGLQRVYRKLGQLNKLQEYQNLFDNWLQLRQSLRLQDNTESEMEPIFSMEEQSIGELLEDYRTEFDSILGEEEQQGSAENGVSSKCSQLAGGRSASPTGGGETSRSTGY